MRIPSFSRQSTTDNTETPARSATAGTTTPSGATAARPRSEEPTAEIRPQHDDRGGATAVRPRRDDDTLTDLSPAPKATGRTDPPAVGRPTRDAITARPVEHDIDRAPAGPKPRASLLATLGLILGVASVLLVLSGPLLGYGIGVAVLGLILSLLGIRATRKRHVAGKTDALIGLLLSIAALVVGVLALTGRLSWLGTDMQPVADAREWLDARFTNLF